MKKLLIVCAFLLSAIGFANAQGGGNRGGTPEERAKRSTDQLVERLKLNDDQTKKVTTIYLDQAKAQTKMMEEMQAGGDRDSMREKMTKMRTDVDTKLNEVLTEDQKKEYKAMQEERVKAMQNRQGGGGGGK